MTQAREDFASPASEETVQQVAQRMRERNIEVVVVDDGDQAREVVLERQPEGAEVHSGKSKTLQDAGIFDAIHGIVCGQAPDRRAGVDKRSHDRDSGPKADRDLEVFF